LFCQPCRIVLTNREDVKKGGTKSLNTRAVAKLLRISVSTVQRWVKQLALEMERNELGHFIFSEDDIALLKEVKNQLQQGKILQEIEISSNKRIGHVKTNDSDEFVEQITSKLKEIEISLEQKADSVVSYQLLQHRREIEELQEQILLLTEKISNLEEVLQRDKEAALSKEKIKNTPRKRNKFLQSIFG
jgi:chromosome-anchoring protein RacA